jgi:hypothetical protein
MITCSRIGQGSQGDIICPDHVQVSNNCTAATATGS